MRDVTIAPLIVGKRHGLVSWLWVIINCDATGFGITTILTWNNTMLLEKKQLKEIANGMKVEHPAELPEVLQDIFFMDGNVYTRRLFDDVHFRLECWQTDVIAARFWPCYLDISFINGGTDGSLFTQILALHLVFPILGCNFAAWVHDADSVWMVCAAVACRFFDWSRSDHSEWRYLVSKKLGFRQTSWQRIYTLQNCRQRWEPNISVSRDAV